MIMPVVSVLERVLAVLVMANILSLDQASHISGYTIWSDGKPIKVSHFNAKGTTLAERLVSIKQ